MLHDNLQSLAHSLYDAHATGRLTPGLLMVALAQLAGPLADAAAVLERAPLPERRESEEWAA